MIRMVESQNTESKQEIKTMQKPEKKYADNPNRRIYIEKVTLSMGTGTDMELLKKGLKLLELISGMKPVKSLAKKRIPAWSVRPGLPIGCKVTLRGKQAEQKLGEFLKALENKLPADCFDDNGTFSFGIKEYIDLPNMDYNYELGILGFQVCVTLARPGFRVKRRKYFKSKIGKNSIITKDDAMSFIKEKYDTSIE